MAAETVNGLSSDPASHASIGAAPVRRSKTIPKKPSDPFLKLPSQSPIHSTTTAGKEREGGAENESLITKVHRGHGGIKLPTRLTCSQIILTPVLAATFIISLFLVDRRNRSYRAAE